MGFFGSIIGAVVDTALTPIAIVKDVVNVANGEDTDATSEHIDGIVEKLKDAVDEI